MKSFTIGAYCVLHISITVISTYYTLLIWWKTAIVRTVLANICDSTAAWILLPQADVPTHVPRLIVAVIFEITGGFS